MFIVHIYNFQKMSQIRNSNSLSGEKTSIHDMLKDTPAHESKNSGPTNSGITTYSRSVPNTLSNSSSSPAILTPSSPSQNDDSTILKTSSRIENLKNWSISTYKCTKQLMFEKLGKTSRTHDAGNIRISLVITYYNKFAFRT